MKIMEQERGCQENESNGTGKKLSLELGGKSPVIVFHNADLDSAGIVVFLT